MVRGLYDTYVPVEDSFLVRFIDHEIRERAKEIPFAILKHADGPCLLARHFLIQIFHAA